VPIPTRYFDDASSINFRRSVVYGLHNLRVMAQYLIQKAGIARFRLFKN
jgi:hypothetical protein